MNYDARAGARELSRISEAGLAWHCVCTITRLEIPDRIADETVGLTTLATDVGVQVNLLRRVLSFLADYGIVVLKRESVSLTDLGQQLRKNHPMSMWYHFSVIGTVDVAHALTNTLLTGRAAAEHTYGVSFWEYLNAHPAEHSIFDTLMRRQDYGLVRDCIPALPWPEAGTVTDAGGGEGALLAAALQTSPTMRGILVEQPTVLERARAFLARRGVADRCELRADGLFTPAPQSDVYILSFVLHDWEDADAMRILSAVGKNAGRASRLRIFEHLIPEDGSPHLGKVYDIGMMLLTGGRERTLSEFGYLLDHSGWEIEKTSTAYGSISLIEARRTSSPTSG